MNAQTMIADSEPPVLPDVRETASAAEISALTDAIAATAGENFVHLVVILLDDSGSIDDCGNTQAVIDGMNALLEKLTKASGKILLYIMCLNQETEVTFRSPSKVPRLTRETFRPSGGTPLFERGVRSLRKLREGAVKLRADGKEVATSHIFFTDGGDTSKGETTADEVLAERNVLRKQFPHIAGGYAVNDGATDFRAVFAAMGIDIAKDMVILEGGEGGNIEAGMTQLGGSISDASTSPADFEKTMTGGIGERTQTGSPPD